MLVRGSQIDARLEMAPLCINVDCTRKALKSPISQSTLGEDVEVYLVVMGEDSVSSYPPSFSPFIVRYPPSDP